MPYHIQITLDDVRHGSPGEIGETIRQVLEHQIDDHSTTRFSVSEVAVHLWPGTAILPPQFVAVQRQVMQGNQCRAVACSTTFARRIANSLNGWRQNRRGQ